MGVVCGSECLPATYNEEATPRSVGRVAPCGDEWPPRQQSAQGSKLTSCCCKPNIDGDLPTSDMCDGSGGSGSSTQDTRSAPWSDSAMTTPMAVQKSAKSEPNDFFDTGPFIAEQDKKLPATCANIDDGSHFESSTCTTDITNTQGTKKLWRRPTQRLARAISRKKSIVEADGPRTSFVASQVPRIPTSNVNVPRDYEWLQSTLEAMCRQEHGELGVRDLQTGKAYAPIFFVIGGCPNLLCGMQAIMYAAADDGEVDFWWVKPAKTTTHDGTAGLELERDTLNRHAKGPHKNDPGRSKPFYKPLADLFAKDAAGKDGVRFGLEQVRSRSGKSCPRAFTEQELDGSSVRMYLVSVWQEDWTTNPFARSKYIKGKLVYQKDPEVSQFFARQYSIVNGRLALAEVEDPPFSSVIPGDDVKELRNYESLL